MLPFTAAFTLDKNKTTKLNYVFSRRPENGDISGTIWIKKLDMPHPPKNITVTLDNHESE